MSEFSMTIFGIGVRILRWWLLALDPENEFRMTVVAVQDDSGDGFRMTIVEVSTFFG